MLYFWPIFLGISLLLNAFFLALWWRRSSKKSPPPYGITFEQLLDQLPGNIFWLDKNCRLIWGNKAHSLAFSHHDKLSGVTAHDLFSKENADRIHRNDLEVMRTGQLAIEEEAANGPNGEPRTYLSYKAPLRNEKGEVVGIIGNALDITSAKKEEMDRLAMLENVIALMPGYVYWINKEGQFLGCNDNEANLLGLSSRKDIIGKTNQELLVSPVVQESFKQLDALNTKVMSTGEDILFEEPGLGETHQGMIFWSHKAPIKNAEDDIIGMVGISMDITPLKRAEAQLKEAKEVAEKASKAKSDFVAVISHEFRTPLTGVLGVVDILLSEEAVFSEKQKEHLKKIRLASRYLLSLVNNILDFAKLDANKLEALHVPFNLFETVQDVFQMLDAQASEKKLPLHLNYAQNLPQQFMGDPKSITQILLNIVGNAIKFTERGKIEVTVEMKALSATQMSVCISIEDTGVGIPKDKLEKVFEEFEQVAPAYSRNYSGTGLGLAVSKRLVELLQGKISVESELHRGTKFTLEFPLTLPVVIEDTGDVAAPSSKYHILLVEDDPLVQFVHKHKLEKLGFSVSVAKDGASALALFDIEKFDLIFMDIGLPDMSGNEVIAWIRKIEKALGKRVPIVALTAYADQANLNKVTAAGADEVLCKPIENTALQEVIARYLPTPSGEK